MTMGYSLRKRRIIQQGGGVERIDDDDIPVGQDGWLFKRVAARRADDVELSGHGLGMGWATGHCGCAHRQHERNYDKLLGATYC